MFMRYKYWKLPTDAVGKVRQCGLASLVVSMSQHWVTRACTSRLIDFNFTISVS
uniref:Uncharacterized protein n=1 Tax=Arundo donax TaxID=35708 RepID=A0A0A8ZGQ5_ARUDO